MSIQLPMGKTVVEIKKVPGGSSFKAKDLCYIEDTVAMESVIGLCLVRITDGYIGVAALGDIVAVKATASHMHSQ